MWTAAWLLTTTAAVQNFVDDNYPWKQRKKTPEKSLEVLELQSKAAITSFHKNKLIAKYSNTVKCNSSIKDKQESTVSEQTKHINGENIKSLPSVKFFGVEIPN